MEGASSLASLVAGLLFGIGWLLWIDGVAFVGTEYDKAVSGAHYIPGFMSTIALFMLNLISWEAVSESYSLMEDGGGAFAKCWVFFAFCLSFAGVIGAIWILVAEMNHPDWEAGSVSVAVRGLLQNLMIFGSSLLFRIARIKSDA